MRHVLLLALLVVAVAIPAASQTRAVLIHTPRPYDAVIDAIEKAGGRVTDRFVYVDGLAAEIPEHALPTIQRLVGAGNIGRDEIVPLPVVDDARTGGLVQAEADLAVPIEPGSTDAVPLNYTYTVALNGLSGLHAAGHTGAGIVVAVIDSGYRPMFAHVAPTRVIGPGINLVPGDPPAVDNANQPHGTQVAGMVAASIAFCAAAANRFVVAAEAFGVASPSVLCPATARLLPMIGSAPSALILPIKVFPAAGGGAPFTRVIAAMERAIELRQKYEAGEPDGVKVQVVNMSLGGPTSAAARTLSDAAVERLLAHDIVPVVSAGNDGFASMTGGSPGTSFAALTVGAASTPVHERIVRAHFFAPCNTQPLAQVVACATAWRPDHNIQVVEFSSRGPTHDGRTDPDVIASGTFSFTQGSGITATTLNWASGTSFSAPTVAGIAAVLRQAAPWATARQIRNAIIMGADPAKIPTATPHDQGAGFVDAAAALALLQSGHVPDSYDRPGSTRNVQANLARAGRLVYEEAVSLHFAGVRPAEVAEVAFLVPENTARLHVRLSDIVPELPPAQQNAFFGDDVLYRIQAAAVHRRDRRVSVFVPAQATRLDTFVRPEAGVWRITPSGDWTNAGRISFRVDAWIEQEPWPQHTARAAITDGATHEYRIQVPPGTSSLDVRLEWQNMWGQYPVNDIDVILTSPSGAVIHACNTGRAPELCAVAAPQAGEWRAHVVGFQVLPFGTPGGRERYTLRISADGAVLRPQ